jgi:hypothetical protein
MFMYVPYMPDLFLFGRALPLLNKWRAFAGVHGISATPLLSTTGIRKGISLSPGLCPGDMTLPDCNTGLDSATIDTISLGARRSGLD